MELDEPLLGAAARGARPLYLELTRTHPLLHAGAALLAFTAQTAALSGAVLLCMLLPPAAQQGAPGPDPGLPAWVLAGGDEDFLFAFTPSDLAAAMPSMAAPPDGNAPPGLLMRVGAFALSAATTVAAAAQLECLHERCALKPCLRRATRLGLAAGFVAVAWCAMLGADGTPPLQRAELAAVLCTAAYSLMLFVWNAVRAMTLAEWDDATQDREEALDAADDADSAACAVSRCADEELAIAAVPMSVDFVSREPRADAVMPWEVNAEDIDAAELLRCASECDCDEAECVIDALAPAEAVRRLDELRLAHPLAAAGAAVLFFAAQVIALGAGVVAADAALSGAAPDQARLCSLALSAVTVGVGAAVLRSELRACAQAPPLRPALLVSAIAGAGTITYMLVFTCGALPGMQGLEVAVSVLMAAASIMLFFWNLVRYSALSELHDADDAAADIDNDDDDDGIAAAKLAAAGQQTDSRSVPCISGDELFFAIKEKATDYEWESREAEYQEVRRQM